MPLLGKIFPVPAARLVREGHFVLKCPRFEFELVMSIVRADLLIIFFNVSTAR